MNRNKRTAIVLGVAVLMASIASLGVYRIVSAMPRAKPRLPRSMPSSRRTSSGSARA